MAYAAVISLKHTMEQFLEAYEIFHAPYRSQILRPAYMEVKSLLKHFKELDGRGKRYANALDEGLREVLHKFEDIIESHISNQLLIAQSRGRTSFSVDLKDIQPEIQTITAALMKMKSANYARESRKMDDDDGDDHVSSRLVDSGGNKAKIVGFCYIKGKLLSPEDLVRTEFFSLVGMAGIGKSTLAKEIFEDLDIVKSFESLVWVSVGRKKCTYVEIAKRILAQLNLDSDLLVGKGDEEISRALQKILNSKRCFVVLDDVWDTEFINDVLVRHKPRRSWVLLTTRLQRVAMMSTGYQMRLMNKEESWNLFCGKVFGEELCPHELVKPGKKIAEKCEGLPLLIVTIASLFSKTDNNLEYWNKVVLLRYLALTYNGKLPPSISKLWKLQFLIVRRHMSINSSGAPSYLPVEIWDMKELNHLQVMGSDLPDSCGKRLPNLSRLIGVSAQSCTKEVLQGIPNLEKLGILIELEPHATEPLHCFDHISNLNELRSLKCVVVNPIIVSPRATPIFKMPSSLQKLHLSGLGYPWKYMTIIAASLPNLREVKLRSYAFEAQSGIQKFTIFQSLLFSLLKTPIWCN